MGKLSLVFSFITCILLAGFFFASCASKPVPGVESQTPQPPLKKEATAPIETEWDKLVREAKKEKKISLYSIANGEFRTPLIKLLKQKFELELEFTSGRAAELTPRLFNERKAGIYSVDVYIGGAGSLVNDLKPAGIFEPLQPRIFLPEALDPKAWWGGELTYVDKDKTIIAMVANPSPSLTINTNLVKDDDVKSYMDLLNPRWKGKMILNDPTTPGVSQFWYVVLVSKILNVDYIRNLVKMDLIVSRDQRLQVEWLSQGKYPIAIAAQQSTVGQFRKDGAPVKLVTPKEGTHVTSSSGNMTILKNAPHPNAARLFVNWLLTKEGQTILSQATNFQSARQDVPTEHLDPDSIRKEGVKYFSSIDEEFLKTFPEYVQTAREIFGQLSR